MQFQIQYSHRSVFYVKGWNNTRRRFYQVSALLQVIYLFLVQLNLFLSFYLPSDLAEDSKLLAVVHWANCNKLLTENRFTFSDPFEGITNGNIVSAVWCTESCKLLLWSKNRSGCKPGELIRPRTPPRLLKLAISGYEGCCCCWLGVEYADGSIPPLPTVTEDPVCDSLGPFWSIWQEKFWLPMSGSLWLKFNIFITLVHSNRFPPTINIICVNSISLTILI